MLIWRRESKFTFRKLIISTTIVFLLFLSYYYGTLQTKVEIASPKPVRRGLTAQTTPPEDPNEPWIETLCWSPRLFLYHHFLEDWECDAIIELAGKDVSRSLVVGAKGKSVESHSRTSSGVFLVESYMKQSPLLRDIERRIAEWTKLPVENGEAFYLLRYEEGQEYKPHTDYFTENKNEEKYVAKEGNRYATVLTYLHTPDKGGETTFPSANIIVPALKGNAVLFYDLDPTNQADHMALHGGLPVQGGIKWAMTKWIRENQFWHYYTTLSAEEKSKLEAEDEQYRKLSHRQEE